MAGINKVILIGNLGQDPESGATNNGSEYCRLSIATTRSYQKGGQGGERVEETEWHRVVVWGKQAEFCSQYLAKGRQVYVEGRLQTRSYDDKDGVKRYSTEVVADTVQFLGGRGGGDGDGDHGSRRGSGRQRNDGGEGRGSKPRSKPPESEYEDDLPW